MCGFFFRKKKYHKWDYQQEVKMCMREPSVYNAKQCGHIEHNFLPRAQWSGEKQVAIVLKQFL